MKQFQEVEALRAARIILHSQGIIAVKGLGGYHLVCDARSAKSLLRLRVGKQRPHKPFAVMFRDVAALQNELYASPQAASMLASREKPIVVLRRRETSTLPHLLAPGLDTIGAMLPYTSLHKALFDEVLDVLVVTSANLSGEPVIFQDDLAPKKLAAIADGILTHNHQIHYPVDDSVLYCVDIALLGQGEQKQGITIRTSTPWDQRHVGDLRRKGIRMTPKTAPILLRRGRGYVPIPVPLSEPLGQTILGCGGDVKGCFCIGQDRLAYPSPSLGNLENPATVDRYRCLLTYYRETFNLDPTIIAYDLNPALITNQIITAEDFGSLTQMPVQHHHAHIAACMGEKGIHSSVIGVAYDGSGYGLDGKVWGGEILLVSPTNFQRLAHWQNVPLPGNDLAIRQPWRMTLSYLKTANLEQACHRFLKDLPEAYRGTVPRLLGLWEAVEASWLETSSMGRLFDGIAAYLGLCLQTTYTGQPAILLENAAWRGVRKLGLDSILPYDVDELSSNTSYEPEAASGRQLTTGGSVQLPKSISLGPLFQFIAKERAKGVDIAVIAARVHRTIAQITSLNAHEFCRQLNIGTVALGGGVWQNQLLCHWTVMYLEEMGLEVIQHQHLSPSDECLGFGQVVVAGARLEAAKEENNPCASPYRQE